MRVPLFIFFVTVTQSFCIPFLAEKIDLHSDFSNLLLLYRIYNRRTIAYTPSALVAYTNANVTVTAIPEDPNLRKCRTTFRLPDGVTMMANGTLSYTGFPTRTVNPISMDIVCLDTANQYTSAAVAFEVRGFDWVKNLAATNYDSPGHDVALGSDSEIYFLASTKNNGYSLFQDFGQSGPKNSSPTPGLSDSPLVLKLNNDGNIIWTRILGGVSQNALKLAVDALENVYTISNLSGVGTLAINADPEFGGTPVNKLPISVGTNFLLSQIRSDGSFGYAISVTSINSSDGTSICYNSKYNAIFAAGKGNNINLGSDFGVSDSEGSLLGFVLELTTQREYLRSKKFLGSLHHIGSIDCRKDGSYTLGIVQLNSLLDFRLSFDGISDIKNAISGGAVGFTSVDSKGNYLFTKFFSHPSTGTILPIVERDNDGNYFLLFSSNGANYDLRIGVDGNSDIKTFAGTTNGSYLVKLNSDGSYAWGKMIRGTQDIYFYSLAVHPTRKSVFLLGEFSGTNIDFFTDFGTSIPLSTLNPTQKSPVLIEVNSKNGSLITARMLAQSNINLSLISMKFDSFGNLYTTGRFAANGNFQFGTDGGIITKNHTYGALVPQAIFAKIRP